MIYKINFKRDECLGCGACLSCDNWEMKTDGKVTPKKTELKNLGCNQQAADVCPQKLITFNSVK